jgi:hypothetical protein
MPIEIRELVVRAVVDEPQAPAAERQAPGRDIEEVKDQIVAECVAKVMDALKVEQER